MPSSHAVRVLVVDDERVVADTLALILNQHGYEARAAHNGDEAEQLATIFQPHALLSDVVMPGTDGIELARWFGVHLPHCKVMLMTGYDGSFEKAQTLPHGALVDILTKPVHPQIILKFLEACAAAVAADG